MQKISVEIKGVRRDVDFAQLRSLARTGFVGDSSRVWVDGRECQFRDISRQVMEATAPSKPAPSVPNSGGNSVPVPPQGNSNLQGSPLPNGAPMAPPSINWGRLVLEFVGVFICVGILIFCINGKGGTKTNREQVPGTPDTSDIPNAPNALDTPVSQQNANDSEESAAKGIDDKNVANGTNSTKNDEPNLDDLLPFDETADKLPERYNGVDSTEIANIASAINATFKPEKDEFETTEEYETRLKEIAKRHLTEPFYKNIRLSSPIAFVIKPEVECDDTMNSIRTKYDADTKILTVSTQDKILLSDLFDAVYRDGVLLYTDTFDRGTYTGSNRFGVEKEIHKMHFFAYGIIFQGAHENIKARQSQKVWILKNVPRDVAKDLSENIAVCCFGRIRNCARNASFYHEPTMDEPNESIFADCCIGLGSLQYWLFDYRSGKVLAKYTADDLDRDVEKEIGELVVPQEPEMTDEEIKRAREEYIEKLTHSMVKSGASSTSSDSLDSSIEESSSDSSIDLNVREVRDSDVPKEEQAEPTPPKVVVPTWEEVYDEASSVPAEDWENASATVVVPDDVPKLFDAVKRAQKSDSDRPVVLIKDDFVESGATMLSPNLKITKPVSIISESGATTVRLKRGSSILVEASGVNFKGIVFERDSDSISTSDSSSSADEPIALIGQGGSARFKECVFDGGSVEWSTGLKLEGDETSASLFNCIFKGFAKSGVNLRRGKSLKVEYCQFIENNAIGIDALSGEFDVQKSRFSKNATAMKCAAAGSVDLCYFDGNKRDVNSATAGAVKVTRKDGKGTRSRRAEDDSENDSKENSKDDSSPFKSQNSSSRKSSNKNGR